MKLADRRNPQRMKNDWHTISNGANFGLMAVVVSVVMTTTK